MHMCVSLSLYIHIYTYILLYFILIVSYYICLRHIILHYIGLRHLGFGPRQRVQGDRVQAVVHLGRGLKVLCIYI